MVFCNKHHQLLNSRLCNFTFIIANKLIKVIFVFVIMFKKIYFSPKNFIVIYIKDFVFNTFYLEYSFNTTKKIQLLFSNLYV